MNRMGPQAWRTGSKQGLLVTVSPKDFSRVGHNWMRGRLLDGDLLFRLKPSGDCFFQYRLVQHGFIIGATNRPGYRLIKESEFGAYDLGTSYRYQPTEREMHLLLANETTSLDAEAIGLVGA
jgi:hypothetical protein